VIEDVKSNKVIHTGKDLKTILNSLKEGGIFLGKVLLESADFWLKPDNPDGLSVGGRQFRGYIRVIRDRDSNFTLINHLQLEDYLKGIAVREVSHYWPMEALKAEVVAFRTYALYQMLQNKNKDKDYDVTADIYSQVYAGRAAERYRINEAVDRTKAEILTYNNRIFPAFYHSTCAGHTASAVLWGLELAPLKGVRCYYCKESPHFNWSRSLSKNTVINALNRAGYRIKGIKDILAIARDESGRVGKLLIIYAGQGREVSAKDLRDIIGPDIIRSTNFQLQVKGESVEFRGTGWGHGVGLCQWGAYFMAKSGSDYREILQYYYPGSILKTGY
jgi:stage II sporulation protein D